MAIILFLFGLIIGSFLNVCIHRIPKKVSVVTPPSACPACGTRLKWFELIPVLSFILQKARCRNCGQQISWRYPLIEITTGLIFYFSFKAFGLSADFFTLITLAALMLVIAFIDIDYKIIPNSLVLFGLAAGILAGLRPGAGIAFMGLGLLTGFGLMMLIAVASRGQMGMGDVKLAAVMGVFLGWQAVLVAIFLAFVTGALYGVFLMVFLGKGRKTAVPFGPFLAGATVAAYIWAGDTISWYWQVMLN